MKFIETIARVSISADEVGVPRAAANNDSLVSILNAIYVWAGIIAVLVIIIAGFLFVFSSGDPSKVKRARDAILYAVIGLIIIIVAFTLTQFVLGRF